MKTLPNLFSKLQEAAASERLKRAKSVSNSRVFAVMQQFWWQNNERRLNYLKF